MSFLDANEAQEYVALMRQAHDIVGGAVEADEAIEECAAWLAGMGLEGGVVGELDDNGNVVWIVKVETGRGSLVQQIGAPANWREAVRDLGLAS